MKYFIFLLMLFPLKAFSQNCKSAYIHEDQILDKLKATPEVQRHVDSLQNAAKADLAIKKARYKKIYHDPKVIKQKMEKDDALKQADIVKQRRKMMTKIYGAKIRDASIKIYDKGKVYQSVFNADNKYYSDIPKDACDVTAECLKMVEDGN